MADLKNSLSETQVIREIGTAEFVKKPRPASSAAQFGDNVRELRQKLKLTLRQLAERSGLAASTISKVENGQISLTYDNILLLASGLGVDVEKLFGVQPTLMTRGMRSVTRKGEGTQLEARDYRYEMLCADLSHKKFVPMLATLPRRQPGSVPPELIRHRGEEFCYVLKGTVTVLTELYEPLILETGDSCYFDSNMGHALVAGGEDDALILWVNSGNAPDLSAFGAIPVPPKTS